MLANKKYVLYAQIKPYNLKISLVFTSDTRIRYVQEFIEDTMRSFRAKYKVGRIEQQKTKLLLLPDYKIGDVLDNKDEIIVYSAEYGLTKTTLSDKSSVEDIDKLFIGKKIKRDSRAISRKDSNDKKEVSKKEDDSDEEENNEEEDENENEDDKSEEGKNKNKNKGKNAKNNKKKKIDDNSSSSGEDNSQDIPIK